MNSIKLASYNCRSVKASLYTVQELCNNHDILLLQEHWLTSDQLEILTNVHDDFFAYGTSSMDTSDSILIGRPYGGLGILWRKCLNNCIEIVHSLCTDRLLCFYINVGSKRMLVINVYLPFQSDDNEDIYLENLGKLSSIIDSCDTCNVIIMGDFNSDVHCQSKFSNYLSDFINTNELTCADKCMLPGDSFTYVSDCHGSTSWLDHCMTSKNVHSSVQNLDILYEHNVTSDHLPVTLSLEVSNMPELHSNVHEADVPNSRNSAKVIWSKFSETELETYKHLTELYLQNISLNTDILCCKDVNCNHKEHMTDLDNMYSCIVEALISSSSVINKRRTNTAYKHVAGWNDFISDAHDDARSAFLTWCQGNRPRGGVLFENMKNTRSNFKALLRKCKKQESTIKSDKLAQALRENDSLKFWQNVKNNFNHKSGLCSSSVEGHTGAAEISQMWSEHFKGIYNSVNDDVSKDIITNTLNVSIVNDFDITVLDVENGIKKLSKGKTCGEDNITPEHILYASDRLHVMLSMFYNCSINHGYLPKAMTNSIIVPLVKNKTGDVTSKDNYRPIGIASAFSKLLEIIILNKCGSYMLSSDHQFAYKPNLGTDTCYFTLKQIVSYYQEQGSNVFIGFLDASKAFDRVNYWKLFNMLLHRGVPVVIVRLLLHWYTTQQFCVRWGNQTSAYFNATNGVRQGSVLSPILFNLYMDGLSKNLINSNTGCHINDVCCNHILYADDLCLIAPSVKSLQKLINICESHSNDFDILFNTKKSVCMYVPSRTCKLNSVPPVYLNGVHLQYVNEVKYLGHLFCCSLKDDRDIQQQTRALYARANSLIRNFINCSLQCKILLFKSFCTCIFGCNLWHDFSNTVFKKLCVAYNKCIRVLFNLPSICSISEHCVTLNLPTINEVLRKNIFSLYNRLGRNNNFLIKNILDSDCLFTSPILKHWRNLLFV